MNDEMGLDDMPDWGWFDCGGGSGGCGGCVVDVVWVVDAGGGGWVGAVDGLVGWDNCGLDDELVDVEEFGVCCCCCWCCCCWFELAVVVLVGLDLIFFLEKKKI